MKKILVWGLSNNRAGTEAVIVNYASRARDVSFDYLCYEVPAAHWAKLDQNDSRYFVIPTKIKNPISNARALRTFMKQHASEYDALWFNVNEASNIDLLKLAARYSIPQRIVHMHSSKLANSLLTRVFHNMNRNKIIELATDCWACSKEAAEFLWKDGEVRVVPNLVDVESVVFSQEKRDTLRGRLGLENSFAVGFAGRLSCEKRPEFLIQLLPLLLKQNPSTKLVYVGEGELEHELRALSESLGVSSAIVFAGVQKDMQAFYSAFDVYAQPSRYEGLSVSILEAQFNGLACVVSDGVSKETDISMDIHHVSTQNREDWVTALMQGSRSNSILPHAKKYDARYADELIANLF